MSELTHLDYMKLVERIEYLESKVEALNSYIDKQLREKYFGEGKVTNWATGKSTTGVGEQQCFFDSLPPEDRTKPMSISCPCRKCSPYSLGG